MARAQAPDPRRVPPRRQSSGVTTARRSGSARRPPPRAPQGRRFPWPFAAGAVVVVGAAVALSVGLTGGNPAQSTPTPTNVLASADTMVQGGAAIDGVQCQTNEQVLFHVHAHLAIYVHGNSVGLPGGIGIAPPRTVQTGFVSSGSCFYWLHVHQADGIIHIESPTQRTYTLGNFFDEWRQPLTGQEVGPSSGPVTAYVNGKVWTKPLSSIPLLSHELIQLDVGSPVVAPQPYSFASGL
jgi:hypothetical protein